MTIKKSKTIVISGASRGIGNAAAHFFLSSGYRVIGISRSASEINHPQFFHANCDVTSDDSLQAALNSLPNLTSVHGVINCAGASVPNNGLPSVDLFKTT